MSTYEFMSGRYGFQMTIPDSWAGSLKDRFVRYLTGVKVLMDSLGAAAWAITLSGSNGEWLNVVIGPLSQDQPEPTVQETKDFFIGYAYRHGLEDIDSGVIQAAGKDHFWAKYYEAGRGQVVLTKKYSLVLNRAEYVITARLGSAAQGSQFTTEADVRHREELYDAAVASFRLTHS